MADVDRCFLAGIRDRSVDAETRAWIREGLGGVILFARHFDSVEDARRLADELRAVREDLLVAVDEEAGDVTRLEVGSGSRWPGNLALGRFGDPGTTRAVANEIGLLAREAGVNLDLAPVADVNDNPVNPVIGTRSFGSDPATVAAHTAAYVQGIQDAGVAACAKHFPGHGATAADSHLSLPELDIGEAELRRVHLPPFEAAVAAGVATVMTAHVTYRCLDDLPATLSARLLRGLLREELGFTGVVVSDALEMAAIRSRTGIERGALEALRAGVDLLCIDAEPWVQRRAREACAAAAADEPGLAAQLSASASRIEALAQRFPAQEHRSAGLAPERSESGEGGDFVGLPSRGLAVARAILVVEGERALPLRGPVYLVPTPGGGLEAIVARLAAACAALGLEAQTVGQLDSAGDAARALGALPASATVVLTVREAHRREADGRFVAAALAARPSSWVVSVGMPLDAALANGRYVGTCGGARPNLLACAELLAGHQHEPGLA